MLHLEIEIKCCYVLSLTGREVHCSYSYKILEPNALCIKQLDNADSPNSRRVQLLLSLFACV